jgi:hypothetical protein
MPNLLKSLAQILQVDPGNVSLIQNYLARLGVELDPRISPPECRAAEAQYLAAELLHREGILSADVLARYRDPWLKWQSEMEDRRAAADRLVEGMRAEWDRVDALPPAEKLATLKAELARLSQNKIGSLNS